MKGWAWAALIFIISALVLAVKFMNPQMAPKSGELDVAAFNNEIFSASKRREDWSSYPLAVARRFAARQCDCSNRQVDSSSGGPNVMIVTVTDAEIPHQMRGHVYHIEIENTRGQLRITKATKEWLPWSRQDASP